MIYLDHKYFESLYKKASINSVPKVDKSGIKRAKTLTIDDGESHSLRRAIERSKSPREVRRDNSRSIEPIYAGGNTASNIRGVIRSEDKKLNEINKKRYGRTSAGYISRSSV